MKQLNKIQKELKAPKGQYNSFGKYKYRSCEDILEAVKPLLWDSILTLTDDIIQVWDRIYVKATAKISNWDEVVEVSALARESLDKKGMDDSQITGTASSYARKYALNWLFLIDDTKDADTDQYTEKTKWKDIITTHNINRLMKCLNDWSITASTPEEAVERAKELYEVPDYAEKTIKERYSKEIWI